MSFRNFGPVVALISLAACATGGTRPADRDARVVTGGATESIRLDPQASAREFSLPAPVAEAWDENTGYRARRIDGQRMSAFFTCGQGVTGAIADTYEVTVIVYTELRTESASVTTLLTQVDASAQSRETRSGTLHCESRGRLEQLIGERVMSMLPGNR